MTKEYIPSQFQLPANIPDRDEKLEEGSLESSLDLAMKITKLSGELDTAANQYEQNLQGIGLYDPEKGIKIVELSQEESKLQLLQTLHDWISSGVKISDKKVLERLRTLFGVREEPEETPESIRRETQGALMDSLGNLVEDHGPIEAVMSGGRDFSLKDTLAAAIQFGHQKPQIASQLLKNISTGQVTGKTRIGAAIQSISEMEMETASLFTPENKKDLSLTEKLYFAVDGILDELGEGGANVARKLEEIVERFIQLKKTGFKFDLSSVLEDTNHLVPDRIVDYSRKLALLTVIKWLDSRINVNNDALTIHTNAITPNEKHALNLMQGQLQVLENQQAVLAKANADLLAHRANDPKWQNQIDLRLEKAREESESLAEKINTFRAESATHEKIFQSLLRGTAGEEDLTNALMNIEMNFSIMPVEQESDVENTKIYCEMDEKEFLTLIGGINKNLWYEDVGKHYPYPVPEIKYDDFPSTYKKEDMLIFNTGNKTSLRIPETLPFIINNFIPALEKKFDWTRHLYLGMNSNKTVKGFFEENQVTIEQEYGFKDPFDFARRSWEAVSEIADIESRDPGYNKRLTKWMKSMQRFPEIAKTESMVKGTPFQMLLIKNRELLGNNMVPQSQELVLLQDGCVLFLSRQNLWKDPMDTQNLHDYISSETYSPRELVHFSPELIRNTPKSFSTSFWQPQKWDLTIKFLPVSEEAIKIASKKNASPNYYLGVLRNLYERAKSDKKHGAAPKVIYLPSGE